MSFALLVRGDSDIVGSVIGWYKVLYCGRPSLRNLWHPASRHAYLALSYGIFDAFLVLGQVALEEYKVPHDVRRFVYYRWYVLVVSYARVGSLRICRGFNISAGVDSPVPGSVRLRTRSVYPLTIFE